jgi:hypothetical protein
MSSFKVWDIVGSAKDAHFVLLEEQDFFVVLHHLDTYMRAAQTSRTGKP